MKIFKIGEDYECEMCETAEDLSIKRFTILKQYMIFIETGVDAPSFEKTIEGFVNGFDSESKSQMLITLYDYLTGVKQVNNGTDAYQMILSLITFEKDEDRTQFDESKAKEKLDRMNKAGLTQAKAKEEVVNFIPASWKRLSSSFQESLMGPTES